MWMSLGIALSLGAAAGYWAYPRIFYPQWTPPKTDWVVKLPSGVSLRVIHDAVLHLKYEKTGSWITLGRSYKFYDHDISIEELWSFRPRPGYSERERVAIGGFQGCKTVYYVGSHGSKEVCLDLAKGPLHVCVRYDAAAESDGENARVIEKILEGIHPVSWKGWDDE
jgi:hypothetical protein